MEVLVFGRIREVRFEKTEEAWCEYGYTLTPIDGVDIRNLAKKHFSMYPVKSYIRTTPDDGDWLIFKFKGYNSEGRFKICGSLKKII